MADFRVSNQGPVPFRKGLKVGPLPKSPLRFGWQDSLAPHAEKEVPPDTKIYLRSLGTYHENVWFSDLFEGYSDAELSEIENKLNVSLTGQFRKFLKLIGKCCGSLPLHEFMIYGPPYSISVRIASHIEQEEDIRSFKPDFVNEGLFWLSAENEMCDLYFLQTKSSTPDAVWRFAEGYGGEPFTLISDDFDAFIKRRIARNGPVYSRAWLTCGDMLGAL